MRFSISREKFQEGLTAIAASIPAKTTLPVLANLLIETTERGIRLSGTDLDIAISTDVAADVEAGGSITLPARKLLELARELPSGTIRFSTAGEQRAVIECGKAKFKLLGLPKDEFPAFPSVRFSDTSRIKAGDLQRLILHTSFAASTEESRPILNGVLWQVSGNQMRMVATNGHRLARYEVQSGVKGKIPDFILPPKALDQIRRLFSDEEEIEFAYGENHVAFRSPLTTIYTRVIEGPYPNYQQVIPQDNDRIAICDRNTLAGAIRRMSIVASDQTHRIRLSFSSALLKLSVQTPDLGEAQDEIAVRYDGDPLDIGFNAVYLLEVLKFIQSEDVKVSFKAPERAATFEPVGGKEKENFLCLVMPLRLLD